MKIKSAILLFVTILLANGNIFAYEGKGFKIISEKITKSPGFKGGFKQLPSKKKWFPTYANAMSQAYNAEGHIKEYITIQGDHRVNIVNTTNQTRRYNYKYTLSCASAYEHFEHTIDIYPQGNFADNSRSYGLVQKEEPGVHKINVTTHISGAESASHTASGILKISR